MRSQQLQFLLILIAVAVGAVVSAQMYWIFNAYELQEKNFRRDAQMALQNTTAYIERTNGCFESFNKINLHEEENILILKRKRNTGTEDIDTVRQFAVAYNSDGLFSFRSFSSPLVSTAEIMIKYHYFPHNVTTLSPLDNPHNSMTRMAKQQEEQFFRGQFALTYAVGEEYFLGYIDSLLQLNLSGQGINSDFKFQLKEQKNDSVLLTSFHNKADVAGAIPFSSAFYENSQFYSPQEIQLWIPAQNQILLSKMGMVMIGSFLVLILLGMVVWMTVRTLLRQKKLALIKNDFINNMTHEFKTPISNISLALETIENSNLINVNNGLRQYLSIINSENIRMDENVEKIMEISMMERNQVTLNKKVCDLNEIVRRVASLFDLLIRERTGKIIINSEKPGIILNCDEVHISNVIYNLIDNAIKYNQENPEVTISMNEVNGTISLLISDNGIGISHEDQQQIFDRFYRVSTGNKHDVKGFGLGLSYVKNIIEGHGGTIQVKSKKGVGSSFTIRLPRVMKEKRRNSWQNLEKLNLW